MSDILLVAVAFDSSAELAQLVASLPGASRRRIRVVIVDNGPRPTVIPSPPDQRVTIESLASHDNPGYGTGVNRGVRLARDEPWLLIVNPDVVFEPGSIDELVDRASEVTDLGMAGPQIRTPIGEVYPSARRLPSLRSGIGHALFSRTWRSNPWTRRYLADRELPPRQRTAEWLSGACLLLPLAAFELVGGFDESYFMYFEDVDLGARLGARGLAIVYVPSAIVFHVGGASTGQSDRRMIIAHHRSAYQYLARRYRRWYLAPLRWALRLGLGVRARVVHG